ncbi:hypothetical protein GGI25_006122 [Coemansia spiralis]|uniref:AB hydrolase-1 domain-containing protein n=2 Tax=Coemansia TaxID=4863 RepID=A0A9W8KVL3_9FUNG|nr:hypothetical protein EDC05_006220 [Coemansia umbellata]KAJ2669499.1 hypothetical protein GGI25_006122 [Coemansia spiralis]
MSPGALFSSSPLATASTSSNTDSDVTRGSKMGSPVSSRSQTSSKSTGSSTSRSASWSPQRLATAVVRAIRQSIPGTKPQQSTEKQQASNLPLSSDVRDFSPVDYQQQNLLPPANAWADSIASRSPTGSSLATKHQTNVPSPLATASSRLSSSSGSPTKQGTGAPSSQAPRSLPPSGAWSLLDMLSISRGKKGRVLSSRSDTRSSSFLSSSPGSSPESTLGLASEKVDAMVARYMNLPDRRQCGHIDVSLAPKKRAGIFPASGRSPPPCDLYYEVFGNGPKKLFLIMGMVGTTMYWRFQTRYFASLGEYTVCVFDNRGSGKSTIAPGPYKISQLAKDAYKLLDHLGWTEDIHMVGISLGGMIAQEMCLRNDHEPADGRPRFASVALVDTWHSAALALPTVQEIRFAFKGMAAFGDDPKHLIKLVFSRDWIHSPFHDSIDTGEPDDGGDNVLLTNKVFMGRLFRAIQSDLSTHREWATQQSRQTTPESLPKDLSPLSPIAASPRLNLLLKPAAKGKPALHHSRSVTNAAAMFKSTEKSPTAAKSFATPSNTQTTKREVAGDIHQFIACMGHRLSAQRVRSIRALNPRTRFLVIHGERDRVIRPVCGRSLAKLLVCPIVWIRTAGHMPPIDAHCTFNLILRAFTRDERWLRELPDRTSLLPATWDEQVKTKLWITSTKPDDLSINMGEQAEWNDGLGNVRLSRLLDSPETNTNGPVRSRRASRIDHIQPVGPLARELLFIDESNIDLAARVVPANVPPKIKHTASNSSTSSSMSAATAQTRELLVCGVLVDAPFRIRRYSLSTAETAM